VKSIAPYRSARALVAGATYQESESVNSFERIRISCSQCDYTLVQL